MILGFTGTQIGMTPAQKEIVKSLLVGVTEVHHGDCIGADAEFSTFAELLGIKIVVHPPLNSTKRAWMPYNEIRVPKEYLDRNHDIVDESQKMIATPKESTEQLRSGTWATIQYAKRTKKPITIILPNGDLI